jgi:hypothetical protein
MLDSNVRGPNTPVVFDLEIKKYRLASGFQWFYLKEALTLHEVKELFIGFGGFQFIQHELNGLDLIHRMEQLA